MRILALEPYGGGSHQAFLDGWSTRSRHEWTLACLPAHQWKWRMRHAAVTLARQVAERVAAGQAWDAVFCSDMLNLAEFRGLAPAQVGRLPAVAYFHENQLTYPVRHDEPRDVHFGLSNMITALAADEVWFNSAYHRDDFLAALRDLLGRMPDRYERDAPDRIAAKARVCPPGIEAMPTRGPRAPGPLRVVWAARWEHDKDPETFFEAIRRVRERGVAVRLSVLGQSFRDVPDAFARAREEFGDCIDQWGYRPSRDAYVAALQAADVFVSTAQHEFFGISAAEAMAAGCYPVLPQRLAYPELLSGLGDAAREFLYEGGAHVLAGRLADLAARMEAGDVWMGNPDRVRQAMGGFAWPRHAPHLDDALDALVTRVTR